MAAVLAAGVGAVLSHRDAAAAWQIRQSSRPRIDVTVPQRCHGRAGLDLHFARLPEDEVTRLHGIPVTTVPRTIFDLAAVAPRRQVERAMHEADVQRLWDPLSVHALVERHPGSRGIALLRQMLGELDRDAVVTRQELEELFVAFLDRLGLPRPNTNRVVELRGRRIEADCVWPDACLIVELDGYAVHGTRRSFETDRVRDRAIQVAEWRVVRVTWRQLHHEPASLAADLRALLAR